MLIDGSHNDDELRALSFWAAGATALDPLVAYQWSTLRVHANGTTHDVPIRDQTYRTLFFADLRREVKARLAQRAGNLVVKGRLDALVEEGDEVTLTVDGATFGARWVFDSRFRLRELAVDERRYHLLRQHFHGWIVRTRDEVFEPEVVTLLDFRAGIRRGTGFFYVLPFSRCEALVELVTLQSVDAEPLTRAYLREVFGVDDVEFVDRESGISPMTEQPFGWRTGSRARRIGVASGRLKASTGYALTRIVDDCARVVRSLEETGHPFAPPTDSGFYRLMDALFLEVWSRRPEQVPGIFTAMFVRNPADRVLRFLGERASPRDVFFLVLSLPKWPFLAAVVRWLWRRLVGYRGRIA